MSRVRFGENVKKKEINVENANIHFVNQDDHLVNHLVLLFSCSSFVSFKKMVTRQEKIKNCIEHCNSWS